MWRHLNSVRTRYAYCTEWLDWQILVTNRPGSFWIEGSATEVFWWTQYFFILQAIASWTFDIIRDLFGLFVGPIFFGQFGKHIRTKTFRITLLWIGLPVRHNGLGNYPMRTWPKLCHVLPHITSKHIQIIFLHYGSGHAAQDEYSWASYQIRNIVGGAWAGNGGNHFPATAA